MGPRRAGRGLHDLRTTSRWRTRSRRAAGLETGRRRPRQRQWRRLEAARSRPAGPHAPAGLHLLDPGARRLGADLHRRLLRRLLGGPARHLQALRRQAPALDLLPRPLRRPGGGARQPVRAAGRPRQAAALCAQGLRGHRGPLVLLALRLRPLGHRPQPGLQLDPPRRRPLARRLDHHPAAGAQPLPDAQPELPPQGPGADPGRLAGGQVLQEADPRALSEPGLFRRGRLRHRGGLPALFQQAGRRS